MQACLKFKKSLLKDSAAKDIHNISMTLIKKHQDSLLQPITHLVNLSIRLSTFPQCWKPAVITPIHKSAEKDTPNNYRLIAILSLKSCRRLLQNNLLNILSQTSFCILNSLVLGANTALKQLIVTC